MANLADFWRTRLETHGHTGWADQRVYCFDQPLRLELFAAYLEGLKPGRALDFGSGTGDFTRLLAQRGWTVAAYDPFVPCPVRRPDVMAIDSLDKASGPFDLVVSVTVLGSIMDGGEFGDTLKALSRLAPGGRFYFLEYATDAAQGPIEHQAFRRLAEWRERCGEAGLSIDSVTPYFHPDDAPSAAWQSYRRSFIQRALARLGRRGFPVAWPLRLLGRICRSVHPYRAPAISPLKIMTGHVSASARQT